MKFLKIVLIALAIIVGETSLAQVPNKPANMTPIVDMAGVIKNDSIVEALNTRLDTLSRRTTNQIVVVTVNDLGGLQANQFATQLGRKWGIGDKKKNNGVVIIVKPKNDKGSGEAFIAPGQGLEGALPDVKCSHIIDSIMLPHFKEGDYAKGIEAVIDHIEPIVIKEYEKQQVEAASKNKTTKSSGNGWWILGGIAAAIGGLALLRKRNKKNMPQQPANGDQTAATSTETAAVAATGAAAALAEGAQPEPQEEDKEPEEDDNDNDNKPDEPEPYKYKYGGGDFGGAGAGKKW